MRAIRGFLAIVKWDLTLEIRRREAVLNMALFAVLVLFIASYGLSARPDLMVRFGPAIFWVSVLFAGTVGLSRAFAVEREAGAMTGLLVSPVDPGVIYLAKAAATWIQVMAMGILVLGAYIILFNYSAWSRIPALLALLGSFVVAYVAVGTVFAAMTESLRGGEVVLRILLFPIMVPAVIIALQGSRWVFPAPDGDPAPFPSKAIVGLLALGAMYLAAGFLLFPKVLEE